MDVSLGFLVWKQTMPIRVTILFIMEGEFCFLILRRFAMLMKTYSIIFKKHFRSAETLGNSSIASNPLKMSSDLVLTIQKMISMLLKRGVRPSI